MNYGRILVIDDEEHIVELIKFNLESNGYEVVTAYDGLEGFKQALEVVPDLILLDLMLPNIDGIEVCRRLKTEEATKEIPIIMLTAKGEEYDKVLGLEMGADDYITKPFGIREMLARIKAVLRRSVKATKTQETTIKIGTITIDVERHVVLKENDELELTLKEFELLKVLAENRGKVLSRNFLLDKVWGYDYYGGTRTVDVHIRHLRKKIENEQEGIRYIETVRGVGYKMK